MFVFENVGRAAADGLDLLVEFSTLGEYGFLPETRPPVAGRPEPLPCEKRARPSFANSDRVVQKQTLRPRSLGEVPRTQVIGALRTPRIEIDWPT